MVQDYLQVGCQDPFLEDDLVDKDYYQQVQSIKNSGYPLLQHALGITRIGAKEGVMAIAQYAFGSQEDRDGLLHIGNSYADQAIEHLSGLAVHKRVHKQLDQLVAPSRYDGWCNANEFYNHELSGAIAHFSGLDRAFQASNLAFDALDLMMSKSHIMMMRESNSHFNHVCLADYVTYTAVDLVHKLGFGVAKNEMSVEEALKEHKDTVDGIKDHVMVPYHFIQTIKYWDKVTDDPTLQNFFVQTKKLGIDPEEVGRIAGDFLECEVPRFLYSHLMLRSQRLELLHRISPLAAQTYMEATVSPSASQHIASPIAHIAYDQGIYEQLISYISVEAQQPTKKPTPVIRETPVVLKPVNLHAATRGTAGHITTDDTNLRIDYLVEELTALGKTSTDLRKLEASLSGLDLPKKMRRREDTWTPLQARTFFDDIMLYIRANDHIPSSDQLSDIYEDVKSM